LSVIAKHGGGKKTEAWGGGRVSSLTGNERPPKLVRGGELRGGGGDTWRNKLLGALNRKGMIVSGRAGAI